MEADAHERAAGTYAVVGQVVEPDEGGVLRLPDADRVPFQGGGYRHY